MSAPTWSFEPGAANLVRSDGKNEFTAAELQSQVWPNCGVCGSTIEVQPIHVPRPLAGVFDAYIVGHVRCPKGCDPSSSGSSAS